MNIKANSAVAISVAAALTFSPVSAFAQANTFSGQAVALRASAVGIALSLSDTGPLPVNGGTLKTSLVTAEVSSSRIRTWPSAHSDVTCG